MAHLPKWFNREIGELGFEPWGWLIPESVLPNPLSPSWNRVRLGRGRRHAGDTLKSAHMGFCRPRARTLGVAPGHLACFTQPNSVRGLLSFQQSSAERLAVCPPCPCKIHGILHNGLSHPKAPALGLCGQSTGPREAEELMQTVPF